MAIAENRNAKTPGSKLPLLVLISIVLVTSGSIGWVRFKQEQNKNIQQSQTYLKQVCQANIPTNSNVLDTSKKVNEAVKLLNSVPNIPGLPYQQAQNELNNFGGCIKGINTTRDFVEAKKISQKALGINQAKILPIKEWQVMSSDLERAIVLLKTIPKDAVVYSKSQKELPNYQKKLQQINQKIHNEESALNAFTQAEDLTKEVDSLTQNSPNIESLSEAESKVKTAIQILEDIPSRTTISEKSQNNLSVYRNKLKDIQYKLSSKQLQPLVKNFSNFANSLDASIGYYEYSKQVNNLQEKFNNLLKESSAINNHPAAKALERALTRYNDALIVWRYCHEGNCLDSLSAVILNPRPVRWLTASFKIKGVPLTKKYQVQLTSNIFGQKFIQQNEALATIWEEAIQEIQEAQKQI
jgi:hypothetical protein